MRHKQVLDELAAPALIRSMDEDLAGWVGRRLRDMGGTRAEVRRLVVEPILRRWRCLLQATEVDTTTRDIAWVALATLVHKYGMRADDVTAAALRAIDDLDEAAVLSAAFTRRSPAIRALLQSPPVPPVRRPPRRRAVTFLRPADVVSIELDGAFHAAFVLHLHEDKGGQCPVIEFYAGRFAAPPTVRQLAGRPAAGGARVRHARFSVSGLTYLPDPARQVRLVTSRHSDKPLSAPPRPGEGLYTVTDLISLQQSMTMLFADTGE
ncbi:hypothetical protein GCM10010156_65360 [Planobispora rosea]|uniref:Uncharacterized protein n=1 Tax=Planobispora rosea TaxID=35762 RepID=A0A8J3S898_PLARO|nr:hypothetical protein [Planobispora rosea]GGS98088.1 hypothetical protein GCM10010156_65360 [Planobispora rosea]GIH87925.1 hypothetical protein Pro02_63330 [Planobispora rosea]